jgi:hypothetical protein
VRSVPRDMPVRYRGSMLGNRRTVAVGFHVIRHDRGSRPWFFREPEDANEPDRSVELTGQSL